MCLLSDIESSADLRELLFLMTKHGPDKKANIDMTHHSTAEM